MREFYSLEDSGRSGFLAVIAGQRDLGTRYMVHVRQVGWLVDVRMMKRRRGWESCKYVCMCVFLCCSCRSCSLLLLCKTNYM